MDRRIDGKIDDDTGGVYSVNILKPVRRDARKIIREGYSIPFPRPSQQCYQFI